MILSRVFSGSLIFSSLQVSNVSFEMQLPIHLVSMKRPIFYSAFLNESPVNEEDPNKPLKSYYPAKKRLLIFVGLGAKNLLNHSLF